MSAKRHVAAIEIPQLAPRPVPTGQPEATWIDPRELLVDEAYQRNLSERSVALIKRIAEGWDWRKFKAPNVAWTVDGLEVIDGQHTAIAAVTRGDIAQIPVLVTEAELQADRAAAFIGLNRDRVAITPAQMHAAAVTAGDEEALAVEAACAAAGISIVKAGANQARQTMALPAITRLVRRYGLHAAEALRVVGEAELAPINAVHIRAVELLLTDAEYAQVEPADITRAIVALGDDAEREAKLFAATHCVPVWKALAITWFRKASKRRRAGASPALTKRGGWAPDAEAAPVLSAVPATAAPPLRPGVSPPRPAALLDDLKVDTRAARPGWAPGRTIRRCSSCDCRFQGAISARQCADCAFGVAL